MSGSGYRKEITRGIDNEEDIGAAKSHLDPGYPNFPTFDPIVRPDRGWNANSNTMRVDEGSAGGFVASTDCLNLGSETEPSLQASTTQPWKNISDFDSDSDFDRDSDTGGPGEFQYEFSEAASPSTIRIDWARKTAKPVQDSKTSNIPPQSSKSLPNKIEQAPYKPLKSQFDKSLIDIIITSPEINEQTKTKYKENFSYIYGVSESKETKGKSLLEAAMWKCGAGRERGNFIIIYKITWELRWFLKSFYPAGQSLGDILTLTGGTIDAYGSSCRDYLGLMFPGIGPLILECLEQTMLATDAGASSSVDLKEKTLGRSEIKCRAFEDYISPRDTIHARHTSLERTSLRFYLHADYTTHIQAALVLSWLCAAVQRSTFDGISNSAVQIDGKIEYKCKRIHIEPKPLQHVRPSTTCWHALFPEGVIAQNFPIPSRKFGRGLEIPFADMALICGSLGIVHYKQGLVVDGISSVLIPRERLPKDEGIQWHFESKIRKDNIRVGYTSDLLDLLDTDYWKNSTDFLVPEDLLDRRCFLAWAETSTIMMGTEDHFLTTTIGESHAKTSASMKYVKAYGLNFVGTSNLLTFGATINLTPTAMPAFFKNSTSNAMRDILTAESTCNPSHFILLYDTGTKIGWYLPQTCVVLHMAHHYLSQQKLELFDEDYQATTLDYIEPYGNNYGGAAAAEILVNSLSWNARRPISKRSHSTQDGSKHAEASSTSSINDDNLIKFRDTIQRLWYLLDTIGSTLKMNRSEYLKSSESVPHGIHGVDFNEILEPKSSEKITSIRYVKLEQPWTYLTDDQATVLFCKNIGQAIVPSGRKLCSSWSKVPCNKDILAMTGTTIHYFLRKNESGLSTELRWILKPPLIQHHTPQKSSNTVVHTQQLKSKESDILAKFKGRVSGQETTYSNPSLLKIIDSKWCLLFTKESGKPCTHSAMDICEKDGASRAEPSSAAISISSRAPLPTAIQKRQEQLNEKLPSNGNTTITISAVMDQPAVTASENPSRKLKGKQPMIDQDVGCQASHEHISETSYNVDTAALATENVILDSIQEEKCSGSHASRTLLVQKVGEPV